MKFVEWNFIFAKKLLFNENELKIIYFFFSFFKNRFTAKKKTAGYKYCDLI